MRRSLLFLFLLLVIQVACAPKTVKMVERAPHPTEAVSKEEEVAGPEGEEGKEGAQEAQGIKEEEVREEEVKIAAKGKVAAPETPSGSPLKDIHFDFDSYTIRAEDLRVLSEIGGWLREKKTIRLLIEGHCDERGTVEYNLILGQKRADAVRAYLVSLGVEGERLRTVSYGKERPIDPRHTEEAWAKNRRAHFEIER
jgi:peptidoglycan-associated lipoprotein